MNRIGVLLILAASLAGCGHAAAVVPPEVTFNNIQWDRLTNDNSLTHGKLDVVIERLTELQSAFDARVPAPEPTPVEPEPESLPVAEVEPQLPESPTAPAAPPGVFLPAPPAVESVAEVTADKPRAVLYVADFHCPPCEAFQANMHRLPFAIEKIVASDSPTHLFPCLVFPDDTSATGWRMHSGTVAALERYLSPTAAPVSVANVRTVRVNGEALNLDSFLASYYRGRWTHPGTVQEHLLEHGVDPADLSGLTNEQMERLHSALHERERGTRPAVRRANVQTVSYRQPVRYASGCPGGVCPPQRRGLFGLFR